MNERKTKKICVFCGSQKGKKEIYIEEARRLGKQIAEKQMTLVYGGGSTGLMGELAREAGEKGAEIIGIIPRFFPSEVVEQSAFVKKIHVENMAERKVKMAEISDFFAVLPGAFGTLDELFEILTLVQLRRTKKGVFLINTDGFYDPILAQLKRMKEDGFLVDEHANLLCIVNSSSDLFTMLENNSREQGTDI